MKNDLLLEPQRLTSTTVKVRRLGYLSAIPSIAQDKEIQLEILKRSLVRWSEENHTFFEHYSLELPVTRIKKHALTGEIKTLGAAGRYINTCEELDLVARVRGFTASKAGKALSALSSKGNPFLLSLGQTFLVLKKLLEKDYDTLNVLVRILGEAERERINLFRNEIQARLIKKAEKATEMNKLYLADLLKTRIDQIRNWRKPKRYYLENIEAPRVEWMLDLKFMRHWNQRLSRFELDERVYSFFKRNIIDHSWLEDEFPHVFADFYEKLLKDRVKQWADLSLDDRLGILTYLLEQSMALFGAGAVLGEISANEFFEYSAAFLIQTRSIIIAPISEFEEDLLDFTRAGKLQYRYVQTVSPADRGYIAKL